ncbi:unnamed protein product [Lactuca saligna]|uniref:Uncharacterized protein n=1 Tax=Lactuca saligna TaxID=75948 RepID=A0AA36EEA1_LACSI|nr:unnamed protein product [Lactuca saligna]
MDESENEEGGFGGTFEDLAFDDKEEDFLDHMLMSMNSVFSFELDGLMKEFEAQMVSKVSGMVKDSELQILEMVDHADQQQS